MTSPFLTYAGVLERTTHLVHTYVPNDPMVVGYQFWGSPTILDAYGSPPGSDVFGAGCAAMFQVARGDTYRSPTLRRKGLAAIPESRKGTTHAAFDPDDFTAAGMGLTIPLEEQWMCLRVQENRNGVGLLDLAGNPADPVLGPIYLVPTTRDFSGSSPTFTTEAKAPIVPGCAPGVPAFFNEDLASTDPRPLYLVFPVPLKEFTLTNLSGAFDLLVSFGPGQALMTIPAQGEISLTSGNTKEMILVSAGAFSCSFALQGVLNRG